MTPTVRPALSVAVWRLAYGSPVSSVTGSASMSVRTRTTGPGPFFEDSDDAELADARGDPAPAFSSSAAIRRAVSCSWYESSGWVCRCL